MKSKKKDILSRLMNVYAEFSNERRINPESRMCSFWEDPTIEILVDSTELNALEIEFGIEIDEDNAVEIYDMSLREASVLIEEMILNQLNEEYDSMQILNDITPDYAKRILIEMWKESYKYRDYIIAMIDKIEFEDTSKLKN